MSQWSGDGAGSGMGGGAEHDVDALIENPFFNRGAIQDPEYFYDRRRQTRRALRMLSKRQCVSVIGPRKIGKTSLLFHLCRTEVMREHGLDPSKYVMVYVNCEDLGHLGRAELYALLLGEIADQVKKHGCAVRVPERPVTHLEFERAVGTVFEQGLNLVLLFDEFELLSENPNLGGAFFSSLRALPTRYGLAYITSSRRPLLGLPQTVDYSPFFNIFVPLKLGLLSETASREVIETSLAKARVSLSPATIESVLEFGGGHPFFLQVAGYWALELQETKGAPLESRDGALLRQSIRGQVESHFDYYWGHLSETDRFVLAALPLTQQEARYREEMELLESMCLVTPSSRSPDGRARYFSPLFHDYVRRQPVDGLLQAGAFVLDLDNGRVMQHENLLALSGSQHALFTYLMQRQGQVISSQELDREALSVPGEPYEYLSDERLKSAIKGLRRALGKDAACIENRRGIGYVFRVRSSLGE
jgi:DNA-binding winged helix-turn-helix (wHTH) protein